MAKIPSPCIGVCKYKREGHCIGCSMTEDQKKIYKSLKNNRFRQGFLTMLDAQQQMLGDYGHWEKPMTVNARRLRPRLRPKSENRSAVKCA